MKLIFICANHYWTNLFNNFNLKHYFALETYYYVIKNFLLPIQETLLLPLTLPFCGNWTSPILGSLKLVAEFLWSLSPNDQTGKLIYSLAHLHINMVIYLAPHPQFWSYGEALEMAHYTWESYNGKSPQFP